MQTVMSFPNRGKWGQSNWRGNVSGYVIKELIEHFNPKLFVDACEGSGTSREVCKDMNVNYVGLDLHNGNDFTKHSIIEHLPRPADIVFTHPPYHDLITYSGQVYGNCGIDGDTSRCENIDEFLSKSQVMLMNQREATRKDGIYATLIGDYNKNGYFRSIQADYINMMPKDELLRVAIKVQHNCTSDKKQYNGNFIPIKHEYLLLWKKKAKSTFAIALDVATDLQRKIASTWRNAIRLAMMKLKKASLDFIYQEVEKVASHLIEKNKHWKAKIRQLLQKHYVNVTRGVWSI